MLVLNPGAPEDRVTAVMERVQRIITEQSGSILKQEQWGVKRLAYPIKHLQEGNYVYTQFDAGPAVGRELDTTLLVMDEVLRYLIVKLEPVKPKRPIRRKLKTAQP